MKQILLAVLLSFLTVGCASLPQWDSNDEVFEYAWEEYGEYENEYCIVSYGVISKQVTVQGCSDD